MSTKNSNFFSRDCMVQALIQLLKTKSLSNIRILPSGCCDMAGQGQLQ